MGMESHPRVVTILPPLSSLRAGVDSQCQRTGEALIQARRDDIRNLTLPKPDVDADVESELLDDRHN